MRGPCRVPDYSTDNKNELLARNEGGGAFVSFWETGREGVAVSHSASRRRGLTRRKVHFLIVSLLNAAFPDHDFSALRPDHFTRERSAAQVLASVMTNFASASGNAAP